MTTSTIGSASRNYSTITAWLAAFAAGGWVGNCYNDSEFNQSVETFPLVFNQATSAANFITLTTAAGQSFRNAGTPVLGYSVSQGVGVSNNGTYNNSKTILVQVDYVTISDLQVQATSVHANIQTVTLGDGSNPIDHSVFDSCIVESTNNASGVTGGVYHCEGGQTKNSLFVNRSNTASTNGIMVGHGATGGSIFNIDNCTVVTPSNFTAGGYAFYGNYNTTVVTNCASFGFGTVLNNTARFTGSDYFATDQATVGVGTHNVTSVPFTTATFATVVDTSHNYKLVTGSSLINVGLTDSNVSPAVDIIGTTRPQGAAWDIGAWEFVSGGGAVKPPPFLNLLGVGN